MSSFEEAKRASSWTSEPRISTKQVIREVAAHTGLDYKQSADAVYAFLHIVKFAAFATEKRVNIRTFGQFAPTLVKGREYGRHVGSPVYRPARMKLTLKGSSLMEVDQWKNTLLIQQSVATALDAVLEPHSMDLSVCVRIADLVLSNKPISDLKGPERIKMIRHWILSIGANPLVSSPNHRLDNNDAPFAVFRYRLRGSERYVSIFDHSPDNWFASIVPKTRYDVIFHESGWSSAEDVRLKGSGAEQELVFHPYGKTPEEQSAALFQAYLVAKYGKK